MTFTEAVKDGFDHYTKFDGRASRPAYWWWFLFGILVYAAAWIIDAALGTSGMHVVPLHAQGSTPIQAPAGSNRWAFRFYADSRRLYMRARSSRHLPRAGQQLDHHAPHELVRPQLLAEVLLLPLRQHPLDHLRR